MLTNKKADYVPRPKSQEPHTISIGLEKIRQFNSPYRRHNNPMELYLLLREVEFINHALGHIAQPGTILDLCCGMGDVSQMLQTQGFRTLGLDLNLLALAEFRHRTQEVSLLQGDALHLPFCDGSLDNIVAIHCFDLLDRVSFLQDCSRVLRSGGLLIFDSLNKHSYKLVLKRLGRLLGPFFIGRQSDKWINVSSFRGVIQIIDQAGLHLEGANGYGWPPFSISSNSRLVNTFVSIERVLRLNRFPCVSPRTVMAVRK